MAAAGEPVTLPAHIRLGASDKPFMDSIISQRAKANWTPHDLEIAADLARMMADLQQERKKLRSEGSVLCEDGKTFKNPRFDMARKLETHILSHRRSLGLHARARDGEIREAGKRDKIAAGHETDANSMMGDGLLAN